MKPTTVFARSFMILAAGTVALGLTAPLAAAKGRMMTPPTFSELDVNGDGAIDQGDLDAHAAARFDAVDTDGNGAISAAEMEAEMMQRAKDRNQDRAARMIERMDRNDDGALDRSELDGMRGKGDRGGRMLERADTDGNGSVSEAEYNAAMEKMAERHGKRHGRDKGHRMHKGG
ncbi:EF-hand domain-containing protein [Oceaniglobus indicus]|uniref:EF-hand domain-containing protein n=1 Tax=Oceaniglobus indicus TaxID=2047749 RepID=UPI000C1915DA|nr:EF-hand domain-containing protein [Oceaniglobus indicus]